MPLTNPPAAGTAVGNLGLLAQTPGNIHTGYSWTYGTTNKGLPAYTSNPQTVAYATAPVALLNACTLTDLNTLRTAVENLRVLTENLAAQHNATGASLLAAGLIST